MQELTLKQKNTQKLTPQQVQLMKLLQVPIAEMQAYISKELTENPALEATPTTSTEDTQEQEEIVTTNDETQQTYLSGQKRKHDTLTDDSLYYKLLVAQPSWQEKLLTQLPFLKLDKRSIPIAKQLIGSLEADGYLRRSLEAIVEDLALLQIQTNVAEVAHTLTQIQSMEPPGIAARSLQECLLLQLKKKKLTPPTELAKKILTHHFKEFTKRHHKKIMQRLKIEDAQTLSSALYVITNLVPQPIASTQPHNPSHILRADFIVTQKNGELQVMLANEYLPKLTIQRNYTRLLKRYTQHKEPQSEEAVAFVKQKINRAQWFIQAIKQRRQTLLRTMKAIVELQKPFFIEESEDLLKPIYLRHVAEKIGMDVSTMSRVVSQKAVQTDWKIYALKFFFSEPIKTTTGNYVSSRLVKKELTNIIEQENKQSPYVDEALKEKLKEKGYLLARRTVAKYREQLKIPRGNMRKNIF